MGGLVVVQHQVQRVCAGSQEDDFEDGVPGGVCEGPKDVCQRNVSEVAAKERKRSPRYLVT